MSRRIGPFTFDLYLALQGVSTHAESYYIEYEHELKDMQEELLQIIKGQLDAAASCGEFSIRLLRTEGDPARYHIDQGKVITDPKPPPYPKGE